MGTIIRRGTTDGKEREFVVAISEKQQEKMRFHIGDEIEGTGWTKKYPLYLSMIGVVAGCWTRNAGVANVRPVSGLAWRM